MGDIQTVAHEEQRIQGPASGSIIIVALVVVVALAFYALMATLADWRIFFAALEAMPREVWFEVAGLSLLSYLARFLRWHGFLGRLGYRVPARRNLDIYLSGFAMTLTPGKAGEIVRSIYLSRYGVGYPDSIGAFVTERLLDLFTVACLALLGTWATPVLQFRILGAVSVCALLLVFLFRSRLMTALTARLERSVLGTYGAKGINAVKFLLSDARLLGSIVLSLLAWGAQGLSLYLIVDGLGYALPLLSVVGIYCLSILAGAASFIPGGLGATELSIVFALGAAGMSQSDAIAASLVARGLTLWLALGLGVWATLRVAESVRGPNSRKILK